MFARALVAKIVERLSEPRRFIQIISGPRQTGKTTAVQQALKKFSCPKHFVSADDPNIVSTQWIRHEWQQARLLTATGEAILVIDEIQRAVNWAAMVKYMWDEDCRMGTPLKVILTGSSNLLLQKGLTESLMGRFEVLNSPHWSYAECQEAFGYSLEDFLFFGGYPGASVLIKNENRWASYLGSAIVEPTVSVDIAQMEEVRKPALLRSLFILGSVYSGQGVSYTKMLGQLQDAGNTVTIAHYLELLKKSGMLSGLSSYSGNQIEVRRSSPKLMVFDTALMTYSYGASRRRLLDSATERGRLVESAVGAYLLARGKDEGFDVYWWRNRNFEVDFVISSGNHLTAIEVKSGRFKNTSGIFEFMRRYPYALTLSVGSPQLSLEDFLLGKSPLFLP